MGTMTICVYGAASDKIDSVFITETEKLGEEIARRHITVIFYRNLFCVVQTFRCVSTYPVLFMCNYILRHMAECFL